MSEPAQNEREVMRRVLGNREAIGSTLLDNNGTAVNVTGLTIKFRMVAVTVPGVAVGTVKVNNAAATLDVAASGKVSYTPAAIDVDTAGLWACYFIDDATIDRLWPYDGAKFLMRIVAETDMA